MKTLILSCGHKKEVNNELANVHITNIKFKKFTQTRCFYCNRLVEVKEIKN